MTKNQLAWFRDDPKRLSSFINQNAFIFGASFFVTLGAFPALVAIKSIGIAETSTNQFLPAFEITRDFALGMDGTMVLAAVMLSLCLSCFSKTNLGVLLLYRDILLEQGLVYDQQAERAKRMIAFGVPAGVAIGAILPFVVQLFL